MSTSNRPITELENLHRQLAEIQGRITEIEGSSASHRLKDLEESLRAAREELSQFAYAASHDLQEPLRTVVTHAQLLARTYESQFDERGGALLAEIEAAALRMRSLILDLLTFSRVVNAPLDENNRADGNAAMQWVVMELAGTISETGAQVTWDRLPAIRMNDDQLVQLLNHLITNALKFRSEAAPRIHVSAGDAGENLVQFTVRDNGCGIEEKYQDRIFGVFKRLHGKDIPGTGIGLAICSKIVTRWGGRLWVESSGKGGSSFHFTAQSVV